MIKETWDITEIRAGEIIGKESIWQEYQDYNSWKLLCSNVSGSSTLLFLRHLPA